MALVDRNEPVYDRQVNQILEALEEGRDRKDIASELGYKNPISLDNYMRRRHFSWDSRKNIFVPAEEKYSAKAKDNVMPLHGISKVKLILSLFESGEADAKAIAKQVGLSDHKELANFMKSKGYIWDATQKNYVKGSKNLPEGTKSEFTHQDFEETDEGNVTFSSSPKNTEGLEELLPVLKLLQRNGDRLQDLLEGTPDIQSIPRYTLIGQDFKCKTVHMLNTLAGLVKAYSDERNINQRDIFEVALVDFFKRYGYKEEIEELLDH